jgi:hypothetical protein
MQPPQWGQAQQQPRPASYNPNRLAAVILIVASAVLTVLFALGMLGRASDKPKRHVIEEEAPDPKPHRPAPNFVRGPSYTADGRAWQAVTVPDGASNACNVASYLHDQNPERRFALFDKRDDKQIAKWVCWRENYPDNAKCPYPKAWADAHYIGPAVPSLKGTWTIDWTRSFDSDRTCSF